MQLSKKIFVYFLLTTYVLVVLHHSVAHDHDIPFGDNSNSGSHSHQQNEELHHEHQYHTGIFHFLGHLFEHVEHVSEHSDSHIATIQKAAVKNASNFSIDINYVITKSDLGILSVDAESLSDPPNFHLILLHRLLQINTPLRAPPSIMA